MSSSTASGSLSSARAGAPGGGGIGAGDVDELKRRCKMLLLALALPLRLRKPLKPPKPRLRPAAPPLGGEELTPGWELENGAAVGLVRARYCWSLEPSATVAAAPFGLRCLSRLKNFILLR